MTIVHCLEEPYVDVVRPGAETAWSTETMSKTILHRSDDPKQTPAHVDLEGIESCIGWGDGGFLGEPEFLTKSGCKAYYPVGSRSSGCDQ